MISVLTEANAGSRSSFITQWSQQLTAQCRRAAPPGEERQTRKLKDEPHQVIQGLREREAKASISPMNPQLGFKFQYLFCSLSSVCWGIIFPAPAGRMEYEQECSRVGREEKNVSLFMWLKFWGQGFLLGEKALNYFLFRQHLGSLPFSVEFQNKRG